MHPTLLQHYQKAVLPNIEEPIREIVNALWELPFVVDTNESCSGHIVTTDWEKSDAAYKPIEDGLYWYPHGIRLGIDFSQEERYRQQAQAFRKDISTLLAGVKAGASLFEQKYRTIEGNIVSVAHATYYGNFPPRDFVPPTASVHEYIASTHTTLINFWDLFARVLTAHNPAATISPIAGKDFMTIASWFDLGDRNRYVSGGIGRPLS